MPSGHQLITHAANYILLLPCQKQRRMPIISREEKFNFFLITIIIFKKPKPLLRADLITSNISDCNLRGISMLC